METYRGTHVIVDLFGCDFSLLNNAKLLEDTLSEAAVEAGCTILHKYTHQFEPYGVTSIIVLSESHISIHSVPQCNKLWLDFFTCGDKATPEKAVQTLLDKFEHTACEMQTLTRH